MIGVAREAAAHGTVADVRPASRFEIVAARAWNVLNEGKPFTPVFVLFTVLLLSAPRLTDGGYWPRAAVSLALLTPLFLLFYRFDFPLRLRWALWVYLGAFLLLFRSFDLTAVALVLALYLGFTVLLWGTVYYHLRIRTRLTNFTRFWRLVLENPDPTSGNFLEQVPKTLILVLLFRYLVDGLTWSAAAGVELYTLAIGVSAVLIHQWFFTWVPPLSLAATRLHAEAGRRISRRFIVIAIDGCRADRLQEAETPCLDRLRREGTEYTRVHTVYPARTVTAFSSMLTGAPPAVHGMRSNFVPSLGVKCDSIFAALRRQGRSGKLVGIAHLVDAFGEEDTRTVTAVMHNDQIDHALVATVKRVLEEESPDLLVLQLLSLDQTGHARGSYNTEYLHKITATDAIIDDFLGWCEAEGYLDGATVLVTSDHGQGIGIGGHGHMTPPEIWVPCILWGAGVPAGRIHTEQRSILDVAATASYFLGAQPPQQCAGQVLAVPEPAAPRPLAVIIPAYNEVATLPSVLAAIPHADLGEVRVIVVDDGSHDGTAEAADRGGADLVVRHERNRGLGAALRSGLVAARSLNAYAAVYLDADGEYDAREIPLLLAPIAAGEADYVLGSRYLGGRRERQTWQRRLGNAAFTALLCILAGRRITDGQTGFRAFSRRALESAEIVHDYNYAQVLTLDLLRKGMRLKEVPITYRRRSAGRSFVNGAYLWRVPLGIAREIIGD